MRYFCDVVKIGETGAVSEQGCYYYDYSYKCYRFVPLQSLVFQQKTTTPSSTWALYRSFFGVRGNYVESSTTKNVKFLHATVRFWTAVKKNFTTMAAHCRRRSVDCSSTPLPSIPLSFQFLLILTDIEDCILLFAAVSSIQEDDDG